jgi:tryptophan synthase alpha chain
MSARIDQTFARARAERRGVLIAYLCIGDPSVEASLTIAEKLVEAGADILELGAPFSDPTADGPVIARASARAIAAGGSLRATIEVARRLRERHPTIPLVVFGYVNPIIVRGEERVVAEAKAAGVDAFLVVDMPPEEGVTLRSAASAAGIDVIPLLAPTSGDDRVAAARRGASGFVYYVSLTGVTGAATSGDPFDAAANEATKLRAAMELPVVVGFGIDDADKARRALGGGRGADGVVVGSAIVRAIESAGGDVARASDAAATVVRAIRQGT